MQCHNNSIWCHDEISHRPGTAWIRSAFRWQITCNHWRKKRWRTKSKLIFCSFAQESESFWILYLDQLICITNYHNKYVIFRRFFITIFHDHTYVSHDDLQIIFPHVKDVQKRCHKEISHQKLRPKPKKRRWWWCRKPRWGKAAEVRPLSTIRTKIQNKRVWRKATAEWYQSHSRSTTL